MRCSRLIDLHNALHTPIKIVYRPGLQIRHFEKNSRTKKLITQGKNSRTQQKLKDLTKFTERRKKLKYFCCKNTFYQKSIAFSYKKTMLPSIISIFC